MPPKPPGLTDYLSDATLREFCDAFDAMTGYQAIIVDQDGRSVLPAALEDDRPATPAPRPDGGGPDACAPIESQSGPLGSLCLGPPVSAVHGRAAPRDWAELGRRIGLGQTQLDDFAQQAQQVAGDPRVAAVQCLPALAGAMARLWDQGRALRQRVHETRALYRLSTLLAGQRDLQSVLDTVVEEVTKLMNAKAASIRLLDDSRRELIIEAAYNLSPAYLNKGTLLLEGSAVDRESLEGKVVYIEDMASDPRIRYPQDAQREGIGSILSTGMVYRGRPVGVMRVYTGHHRVFDELAQALRQAIAQAAGAAIRNSQLAAEQAESERVQRQLKMASDVQRRLMPLQEMSYPPYEVAGRYEPCFELGGDFYDVIPLTGNLGVVVGDVVGKGVAASLLMASVRAALRAHSESIDDIDEIFVRTNVMLAHDTLDNEFATVFYGAFDQADRRLTYCSAGHDPALLYRRGRFSELDVGGMVMGVDDTQQYQKGVVALEPGDIVLIHTDGVTDASNFNGEKFGRDRVRQAIAQTAEGTVSDVVNHVLWEVRRFVGLNHRPDDMTLVAVKVR